MPPKVTQPDGSGPPAGQHQVTFDVLRISPLVGNAQKFRFTVEVFRADNIFARGGDLKVLHVSGTARRLVFSVHVPRQPHSTNPAFTTLQFIGEATVTGEVPVQPDPTQCFTLSYSALNSERRHDPWQDLRYSLAIKA
jgi:hypothetical protein